MIIERNVYEVCLWDELKKWSSHLLDNLSNCLVCVSEIFQVTSTGFHGFETRWRHLMHRWDNCLNCPASARIISSIHVWSLFWAMEWMNLSMIGWKVGATQQEARGNHGNLVKGSTSAPVSHTVYNVRILISRPWKSWNFIWSVMENCKCKLIMAVSKQW